MTDGAKDKLHQQVVEVCHRLYHGGYVVGRGGNVSLRWDDHSILITPHGAPLGWVQPENLQVIDREGKILKGWGKPSLEIGLHVAIYKQLKINAVIHAHPPMALLLAQKGVQPKPFNFEAQFLLGEVPLVPQETPTVTDMKPVLAALENNNIIILKNHGVVSVGDTLLDALFLIEHLEEAGRLMVYSRIWGETAEKQATKSVAERRYPLFSKEHMEAIVTLINGDAEVSRRGRATALNTRLGIKLDDNGQVYQFNMEAGKIVQMLSQEDQADFLISGPSRHWRAVFNGETNPFTAQTQGKLKLRGELGKLSQWYSPFARIFELWKEVPVE
jgi:L-fuculose-phosphate aldolase